MVNVELLLMAPTEIVLPVSMVTVCPAPALVLSMVPEKLMAPLVLVIETGPSDRIPPPDILPVDEAIVTPEPVPPDMLLIVPLI